MKIFYAINFLFVFIFDVFLMHQHGSCVII